MAKQNTTKPHVVIISWDGMSDRARTIATGLDPVASRMTVIYSNHAARPEHGPGNWVQVPQSDYFGPKFRLSLDHVAKDEPLLLIQADAVCDDWPALYTRCAEVLARHPDIGLWSPSISNTPFPNNLVAAGPYADGLIEVAQCDAIVLALHPAVTARLRQLDYTDNNLGWGIDWAAIGFARTKGMAVVRDLLLRVEHPKSRGYDDGDAQSQMSRFLDQLAPDERAMCRDIDQHLRISVAERHGRAHIARPILKDRRTMDQPQFAMQDDLLAHVHFLHLARGKLVISPVDPNAPLSLSWPGTELAIDTPCSTMLPTALDLAIPQGDSRFSTSNVTGLNWSCPGQSTVSVVFPPGAAATRVPIIAATDLSAANGDLHLVMGLAVHRANADLLVEWHDLGDPEAREEVYVKFDRSFAGLHALGDYQAVKLRIPSGKAPTILRVTLCFWGGGGTGNEPSALFLTRPVIQSTIAMESAIKPLIVVGDANVAATSPRFEATLANVTGPVTLNIGNASIPLIPSPDLDIRLERQATGISAFASAPCAATLFLNGRSTRALWIGPEASPLNLPEQVLAETGTTVELRDMTGNLPYASLRTEAAASPQATPQRHPDAWAVDALLDAAFYLAGFPANDRPEDPASHYLTEGWAAGHDPAPWFSTRHYLAMHPDVAAAGMNPFLHYCLAGRGENRTLPKLGRHDHGNAYKAHAFATAPGPHFEPFDPGIGTGRRPRAKALAYYLPQFHSVAVNNENWGEGFTEWRNLPRAVARFMGHIQPRIPRDLGTYDLAESDVMRRQIAMAKAAGLHGFCFYHYWFDGKRVLEAPMERLLADPSLDFPFCLMWTNENWTRTWDGSEKEIILSQSYATADDAAFIDDLARHMVDPRYIRVGDRPLFFIYRPGQIPDAPQTIARWRQVMRDRHGIDPLIMMAQGFGDLDPRPYGLDGAIEFPPHKICQDLPAINHEVGLLDDGYTGHIIRYDDMVARSVEETGAPFPLIRTATPTWDNEPRRPGRGMILHGSTPAKFESWLDTLIRYSTANPVFGEAFICVNAWNEWAEGAVLEPDVHHGAAYLNALSRALYNVTRLSATSQRRIVIVGHDANSNGAQLLALHIGQTLKRHFGFTVAYLLGEGGPLLADYRKIGSVTVLSTTSPDLKPAIKALAADGFKLALTNTTPSGAMVPALKEAGFKVASLIHELPNVLKSYGLESAARNIATHSDQVIFPAAIVRDGFETFAGPITHGSEVFPQGLYNTAVLDTPPGDKGLRAELGLPPQTRIVLSMGYADLRKGIDRFIATALSLCSRHDDIAFLWVGAPAGESIHWFQPEIDASGLGDRIRILGHRSEIARFFAAADLFYLPSREDPFPSVVLEALACGLPVIGHQGTGGCDTLIARHGTLVPQNDPQQVGTAILETLALNPAQRQTDADTRRREIIENYDFAAYVFGLTTRLQPDLPTVSAVIPNYKYQSYIGERLRSVFDQTCPLLEIIVLDDASPDNSVAEIHRTAQSADRTIALHINATNSGSPFRQWRKGVELAKGDYVWIAEADDTADPSLIARLVQQMQLSGSVLGFVDSKQIDEDGALMGDSYRPYANQIEAGAFDAPFDMDGHAFLARFLAVKNVILNVSGVVFRRDALLDALDAVGPGLYDYRVAGDWRLYAQLCASGGKVSYLPDALNAHRLHPTSATLALNVDKHLAEISRMHALVAALTPLDDATRAKQAEHLAASKDHLDAAALKIRQDARPNLFIVGSMKCGTTILHDFLKTHPDIRAGSEKECHYFSLNFDKGLDWYLEKFRPAGRSKYFLDASPTYFDMSLTLPTAERIEAFSPDAKIIILLRNPIDRAISHYNHLKTVNKFPILRTLSFDDFITRRWPETASKRRLEEFREMIVGFSRYAPKVQKFIDIFGRDNVLVVHNDDLRHSGTTVVPQVFDFLGLQAPGNVDFTKENYLQASTPISPETYFALLTELGDDYYTACRLIDARRPVAPQGSPPFNQPVGALCNEVAVGKDGWLFLAGGSNDVLGMFTEDDIAQQQVCGAWHDIIRKRRHALIQIGAAYHHMMLPEKLTVVGEKLDWPIDQSRSRGTTFFDTAPADIKPSLIDLTRPFRARKDREDLYLKTDSHWNGLGAFAAYQQVCRHLGIVPRADLMNRPRNSGDLVLDLGSKLPDRPAEHATFIQFRQEADLVSDKGLVNFKRRNKRESDGDLHTGSYVSFRNDLASRSEHIVIFGDSFSEYRDHLLTALMAETFAETTFVWSTSLDLGLCDRIRPDIVFSFMTERFMSRCPDDSFDVWDYTAKRLAGLADN